MDYLASMYIDNELSLDEKVDFIDRIHSEPPFYQDARSLLVQEKLLRTAPDTSMLAARPPVTKKGRAWFRNVWQPVVYAVAGFAAAALVMFHPTAPAPGPQCFNRFVLYEPAAHQVELAGSFTSWQRTPMEPLGDSGYWELRISVPSGEHRFAYIIDGSRQEADPTFLVREKDDFGGENSILTVEEHV